MSTEETCEQNWIRDRTWLPISKIELPSATLLQSRKNTQKRFRHGQVRDIVIIRSACNHQNHRDRTPSSKLVGMKYEKFIYSFLT